MLHHQGKIKIFDIVFNIYWLYHGIYRQFIHALTNSVQNIVRNQQLQNFTADCFRLFTTDKFNRINFLL